MTNLTTRLSDLRRPRLLVRAARHGVASYQRTRDLRRISGQSRTAAPQSVVEALLHQEEQLEQIRLAHEGTYSVSKHVELLIALMAESRNLTAPASTNDRLGWRPSVVSNN